MSRFRSIAEAARILAGVVALALLASACSDDGESTSSGDAEATQRSRDQGEPETSGALDPSLANELADGTGLVFGVREVELDDDSEDYPASIVVPDGWEIDTFIEMSVEPPSGSDVGFFTEMGFRAGCSGSCEATDWEARLRGTDGALAALAVLEDYDERPTTEGDGVVVTGIGGLSKPTAVVFRWDDSADRFFRCKADLDRDDADLLPAFVAACEASRPGWFSA